MATKKKATKASKKARPRKAVGGGRPWKGPRPCVPPEICDYLKALGQYFTKFEADYTALRIAMCNVEAQAFSGAGVQGKRFPPCGGGMAGDPTPPPQPPKWT